MNILPDYQVAMTVHIINSIPDYKTENTLKTHQTFILIIHYRR